MLLLGIFKQDFIDLTVILQIYYINAHKQHTRFKRFNLFLMISLNDCMYIDFFFLMSVIQNYSFSINQRREGRRTEHSLYFIPWLSMSPLMWSAVLVPIQAKGSNVIHQPLLSSSIQLVTTKGYIIIISKEYWYTWQHIVCYLPSDISKAEDRRGNFFE